MPITECAVHGESGSLEMCEHLKAGLDRGVYLEVHTLPVYTIRMCDACFEAHDVQAMLDGIRLQRSEVEALRSEATGVASIGPDYLFESAVLERDHPEALAEIVRIYGVLNDKSGVSCSGCIDQIQLDHARATGAELPFEPFENTLMRGGDDRVEDLRQLVLNNLNPRGNHGTEFFGCTVFAGTVRRPLTLKIYGVKADAQAAMLERIEGYFDGVVQNQRLVQFYEPVRWTVTELDDGMTMTSRIPDVLLAETLVR